MEGIRIEVMRDLADNVIIVCSIENFDPWRAHRRFHHGGPAQTLTDREYSTCATRRSK